jgi:hypothetical protein
MGKRSILLSKKTELRHLILEIIDGDEDRVKID